ncbi:uncharacterized protein B0P05DRAFT_537368 [Gilbertella persicaria]|uniref:uncharacterized protein n=1 Tax=Gilbertella persicaria TaxID=101096 RepID=UPI002220065D|nr:uncharacterized protein B0P05DRAFT_537368 [Gilbertella persicaria]KAI8082517.1 hypothetical protein B0P05DRAFT_537368 [Gilbertella persicaria]
MPEEGYQVLKKSKEEHKKSQLSTKLEETNDPLSSVSQEEGRRTSIVSTATQSLLGEHITDKLAFIKNSIIMNSDDEQEEESNATINNKDSDVEDIPRTLHRRASSILKVGQDIVKMISGVAEEEQEVQDTDHKLSSSVSSTTSSFMTPSSLFSALTGAIPESSFSSSSVSTKKRQEEGLVNNIIQEEDEEDEELFDFTKVIEIGKNVKTFSKGVVGNSIRMFSDVATQIKTSIEEEEIKRRQEALATMKQDDHSADENEWMHNYL